MLRLILKLLCHLAILAVLVFGPTAWAQGDEPQSTELKPADMKAHVEVAKVESGSLPLTLHALGRIAAPPQAHTTVAALGAGVVLHVAVREGERVTSGTLILTLDNRTARAQLEQARSLLALAQSEARHGESTDLAQQQSELDAAARQAQATAAGLRREAESQAQLLAKGLTSTKAEADARRASDAAELDTAQAQRKAEIFRGTGRSMERQRLEGKVRDAQGAVRLAEIEVESGSVYAPMTGRITRLTATAGVAVDKGAALAEIEPAGSLGVRFSLSPASARQIRSGAALTLFQDSSTTEGEHEALQGRIVAVGGGIDVETGLVTIEGVLEPVDSSDTSATQPFMGETLPGLITLGAAREGLLVPRSALTQPESGTGWIVMRIDEGKHAEPVEVHLVTETATQAIIASPDLNAGDSVIRDGNYNLPEGAGVVTGEEHTSETLHAGEGH